MTSVRSIMSDDILTLGIENTLSDARIMMVENNIRHIPIVDDEQVLMGLVSQRDVLSVEESTLFDINVTSRLDREQCVKINDFYRRDFVNVSINLIEVLSSRETD